MTVVFGGTLTMLRWRCALEDRARDTAWLTKRMNRRLDGVTRIALVCVAMLMAVCGCVVGPDYERPTVDVPSDWVAMMPDADAGVVDGTRLPEAQWWRAFQNDELTRLIELAVVKNHDLHQASLRVLEGRALAVAAGAGRYPQVNIQGAYTRVRRSETILANPTGASPEGFAPPGASFDIWNAALDLRWELDLWGRIQRGVEASEADAEALEMERRGVTLSLMSDIGDAYFRVRELDEQIEIAEKNLKLREQSLALLTTQADAGLISVLDVKRGEMLVAESAAQLPELRRRRAVQAHQLELLTGASPNTLRLPFRPLRRVVVQPEIPVGLPADLLERRPDIVAVERSLVAANARIGEARAYFFPSLSITGNGGYQTSEFDQWFDWASRSLNIGPSLTLPIFLGKTNVARLEVAEIRYEQLLQRYHQTILNAFREVADLLMALHTRAEQLTHQEVQVAAAKEAWELASIRYRRGLISFLDVLDAQRSVLNAEQALVSTERERLSAMVALYKAVGGGWTVSDDA